MTLFHEICRKSVENVSLFGKIQAKIRLKWGKMRPKSGPGLAKEWSRTGQRVVPDWPQWELQWGYSGDRSPDPYHGAVLGNAPSRHTTTPGTPPMHHRVHTGVTGSAQSVTTVHQASFRYSHRARIPTCLKTTRNDTTRDTTRDTASDTTGLLMTKQSKPLSNPRGFCRNVQNWEYLKF